MQFAIEQQNENLINWRFYTYHSLIDSFSLVGASGKNCAGASPSVTWPKWRTVQFFASPTVARGKATKKNVLSVKFVTFDPTIVCGMRCALCTCIRLYPWFISWNKKRENDICVLKALARERKINHSFIHFTYIKTSIKYLLLVKEHHHS